MTPADQTSPRAKSLARVYAYLLRRADQIEAQKQTTDPTRRDDNEPRRQDEPDHDATKPGEDQA